MTNGKKALDLRMAAGVLVTEARGILDPAEKANRSLSKEEQGRFDALHVEAEKKLQRAQALEQQDAADAGFTEPANGPTRDGGAYISPNQDTDVDQSDSFRPASKDGWQKLEAPVFGNEVRMASRVKNDLPDGIRAEEFSWGRALRGIVLGQWGSGPERRALAEGAGGTGGWLVPSSLSSRVIDLARNQARVTQAGALTLPMTTGEMTIARLLSDPTCYWVAENASITESAVSFDALKLKPLTLACIIAISKELIEDASLLSSTVENVMSSALALELDRVALLGSGAGEPRGLWNTPGVGEYSMGDDGAAFATSLGFLPFSHAVEMIADNNAEAQAVIFSPRTAGQLDRLLNGDGDPLQQIPSYAALRKYASKQVPDDQAQGSATDASCAFVGDFRELVIGMRTNIELEASREAGNAFSKKQTLVRALLRADVAVFRPASFCIIKGIIPA